MSCPEPPIGISSVVSFPVWSGGALNIFSYFFSGRHFLHLGVSRCPSIHLDAPCIQMPPQCPHMFKHPHMSPMLPCASACSEGYLHMIGGCGGTSSVWTTPLVLDASPCVHHLPHIYMPTCMSVYCRGYCMYDGGNIPYVGGLGVSAYLSGFGCLSVHPFDVHYASSCTFLLVHYVSCLYFYHYDFYSSSDCGVFWCVISIISDHGYLFNGASYNVGSAGCCSAATPDTKRLWRCSWPCLHATASISIFDASSGLCQLYHGFSTGRFLFQS